MSWYLANQNEVLDQFASGGGLTDLVAASQDYAALKTFFSDGLTKNVDLCANQLHKLASRHPDEDVASTAKGLADLMKGQHFVAITQGFGFQAEHDSEKDDTPEATPANESLREVESGTRPPLQIRRDKAIAGPMRVIQKLMRSRFRSQRKAVLDSHALRNLSHLKEAETEEQARQRVVDESSAAFGPIIMHQPVTASDAEKFDAAVTAAIKSGAAGTAELLDSTVQDTESFVTDYLKDGGFTKLTGGIDQTTLDRLANAVADAFEGGAGFDGVVQAVKDSFAKANDVRAKMIAQTELNGAFNQSIMHFGKESGAEVKWWETDLTPCVICIANSLQGRIPIDEEFESGDDAPTAHPNCFLGGTLVTAKDVSTAFRRRYKGEICILSFAGFPDLSVTPNHPILTRLGWIPAGELKIHDDVLQRCGPPDPSALVNPHDDCVETSIEEVFDAFSLAHGGASCGVPISTEAFHGDSSSDNKVDVVNPAGMFTLNGSEGPENFQYLNFTDTRFMPRELKRNGALCLLFHACDSSTDGVVSGSRIGAALLGSEFGVAHELSGSGIALLEPQDAPMPEDGRPGHANPIGDCEDAFPFQVRTVKVVKIERRQFDGHVFNLETKTGIYFAGSILVHNCLCSLMVGADI